jgi:histidine ammonia-lyase
MQDVADPAAFPALPLAAGEALPMIAQSSVVTAHAAAALAEAALLHRQMVVLAALDLEAFAANTSPYHEAVGAARPYRCTPRPTAAQAAQTACAAGRFASSLHTAL